MLPASRVSRVLTLPPRWRAPSPWGRGRRSRLGTDPVDAEQQGADADDPDHHALADRPDAADAGTARVLHALDRLDVVDDRALLLRRELVVAEHRHVLRAGEHRGVDLEVSGIAQRRRVLAAGERSALTDEVVAGGAVEAEQLATCGQVAVA